MGLKRASRVRWKGVAAAAAAIAAVLTTGCGEHYHDVDAFLTEPHPIVEGRPYLVAPPDVLLVQSVEVPELRRQQVIVGPEGTADLPLIGSVQVVGRTVEQIAELIEEKALAYYQSADVSVSVISYRSKHIYVFGEVGVAGRYPFTGSNTLLELLAQAQPSRAADPRRIQLYRPAGDGVNVERMTIDLDQWVKEGVTDRNTLLSEGDIVFVPPNGFAEVGFMIENLLRPVSPAAATMRGTASVEDSYTDLADPSN